MIRLAIIGTGGMANSHAKHFAAIEGVQLAACCDVDLPKARAFARAHRVPRAYPDLSTLLRLSEVDAVTNVTPDRFHAELSIQALRAKKHVFCEKPLATNYAEARRMLSAATKSGCINMVNFSYRNSAALQEVRRRIARGDLGRVFHVQAHYLQSWLTSKEWADWRISPMFLWRLSERHGSKGVLGDVGVHILDFASYPLGEIVSVNCRLKTFPKAPNNRVGKYPLDANDTAVATIEYTGGAIGSVQTTRLATGHVNSLHLSLHGEYGAFRIDLDTSYSEYEECFVQKKDGKTTPWAKVTAPPVPTLYERFISSIRSGVSDQPDFARGTMIQKVLDACARSHASGRTVRV